MDGGDDVQPLFFIRTEIDTDWAVHHFQITVLHRFPAGAPLLPMILLVPVNSVLLMAFPVPGWKPDALAVLVKVINFSGFGKPFSMPVHCPHGQHHMTMGIVSRWLGVMDGKINNHAFANKKLIAVVLHHLRIQFLRYFSGQCQHKPSGKLRVPLVFNGFYCVPELFPVGVFWRGMGRQHDFRVDHTFLFSVVFVLLVILGKQILAALVGSSGNS